MENKIEFDLRVIIWWQLKHMNTFRTIGTKGLVTSSLERLHGWLLIILAYVVLKCDARIDDEVSYHDTEMKKDRWAPLGWRNYIG